MHERLDQPDLLLVPVGVRPILPVEVQLEALRQLADARGIDTATQMGQQVEDSLARMVRYSGRLAGKVSGEAANPHAVSLGVHPHDAGSSAIRPG